MKTVEELIEEAAGAEATKRYPRDPDDSEPTDTTGIAQETFVAGAKWQASRPITDEQVEVAAKSIWEVRNVISDDEWWERIEQGPYLRMARAALEAARGVQS